MKTFIEHVAEDLLSKFGNNLSDVTVIFPNKRASLFLNEALATYSERPVLAPKYYTISELFCDASDAIVGDRIELVFLLYKVYQEVTKSDETLDRFFPWGEIIINDFDDIDKHMLDADKIFTNVKDIHEFDDIEFLSDEQKEVLKHFFPNYEGNNTHLKEKFLKLWSKLAEIYTAFQEAMRQSGIMYEGALYRYATDKIAQTIAAGNEIKHYVFVGFNHLLPVENQLFKTIKNNIDTLFYWDYDNFYINNHEAGNDIKQNLILFPNALGGNEEIYDNFSKPKDIQVLTSSTDNLQARYVYNWVQENNRAASGRKSVIVLADESLLPTVIHSLPKEVDKVNITIGYNLSFTDIPLIINHLMSDRKYKTAKTLSDKLSYLATAIHEKAQRPFPDPSLAGQGANYSSPYKGEAGRGSEALRTESLFRTYTLINRLKNLIDKNAPDITEVTMQRLLNQLISTTSVPFHGEPLEGLQIMGVLETRNLDFDNVLMLSCNEGIMPKASDATSFIPYFLRKAYGLTTIDNKVSTYSYYFYRLLQRCNNATLLWNKSTEGMHRGEMSRFILQLMVESSHQIKRLALSTGQTASTNQPVAIEKTDEILQAMKQRFLNLEPGTLNLKPKTLSPTALNTYLRCQKKFYYHYVLQLQEYEDPEDIEQDSRTFGNIFHDAVHQIYKQFVGREVTKEALKRINDHKLIRRTVTECYLNELKKKVTLADDYKFDGLQSIQIEVITKYISRLIDIDTNLAPFTILALEEKFTEKFVYNLQHTLPLRGGDGEGPLHSPYGGETEGGSLTIGGIIDRLDMVTINGQKAIRVVDYKTGASKFEMKLNGVSDIFDPSYIKDHSDYYLQTYLYSSIINHLQLTTHTPPTVGRRRGAITLPLRGGDGEGPFPIYPALIFIQHASGDNYDPTLHFKGTDAQPISEYDKEFREHLQSLIEEIFNPQKPFVPFASTDAADDKACSYCPFRTICR